MGNGARCLAVALLFGAACSFDTSGLSGTADDGSVPDVDASVTDATVADADLDIDADTTVDAAPTIDAMPSFDASPDAMVCTTECVSATELRDCDQGGIIVDCPLGCGGDVAEPPHCLQLVPSNGATADDLLGVSGALDLADDELGVIDTDTGEIVIDGVVFRDPVVGIGSEGINYVQVSNSVGLLAVTSMTMDPGSILIADGDRALIILSRGDVTITGGFVGVGAGCGPIDEVTCGGPGAGDGSSGPGDPATGCAAGGAGAGGGGGDESGGGGGGLGQDGADGGDGNQVARPGGAGGTIAGACPGPTAVPLVGGSGGGHGGGGNQVGGDGGGGGGALQISSLGSIAITTVGMQYGILWAGGAGGQDALTTSGGGGGGSGGTILLEAASLELVGAITANGGGGGDGISGGNGEFGLISTDPAQGGGMGGPNSGGNGGSATATPTEGSGPIDGAGGGGGGAGIIRFNVPAADLSLTGPVSPAHTRGDPAVE